MQGALVHGPSPHLQSRAKLFLGIPTPWHRRRCHGMAQWGSRAQRRAEESRHASAIIRAEVVAPPKEQQVRMYGIHRAWSPVLTQGRRHSRSLLGCVALRTDGILNGMHLVQDGE